MFLSCCIVCRNRSSSSFFPLAIMLYFPIVEFFMMEPVLVRRLVVPPSLEEAISLSFDWGVCSWGFPISMSRYFMGSELS